MLFLQAASVVSPGTPAVSTRRSAEGVGTEDAVSTATIRKRVAEVGVNFTVQDNRVLVRNLRREEVTVLEDGRVIPDIVLFSQPSDVTLKVALLIDRSDSMIKGFAELRRGAQRFLDLVLSSEENSVLVADFATEPSFWQAPSGISPDLMSAHLESFHPGGLTALYDALYAASHDPMMSIPEPRPVRRLLILLSDGEDNYSFHGLQDAIEAAQRNDIAIYAVTVHDRRNSYPGDAVLERLAAATGGRAFVLKKFDAVDQVFAQIEGELEAQYSVWFRSQAAHAGYHRVQVLPRTAGLRIHAREGYYSCAP
jgi:Ca-activated chloride channel family protein